MADLVGEWFLASIWRKIDQFEQYTPQRIGHAEVKGEPNLWLQRVGWEEHLYGTDHTMLSAAANLDAGTGWGGEDEKYAPVLEVVWAGLDRLFQSAQETATLTVVGINPLYEINRRKADIKPASPFNSRMEPNTVKKYSRIWKRILGSTYRRPRCGLMTSTAHRTS